jgi:hypothetical protein
MSFRPLAAVRDAPADVLARFRETDSTAALVYLGMGYWALGSVQPSTYRAKTARRVLARFDELPVAMRRPGRYLFARLLESGFRPIQVYTEREIQSGTAIRDFRERDWHFRNRPEEAFTDAMGRVDGEQDTQNQIVRILDAVHTTFPDALRHARGRRGVLNAGLN